MTDQDDSNANAISEKQLNAIPHIIVARTMAEAAEKAGISRNTLYEWMKIPAFNAELRRHREMVVEEAMERLKLNVVKAVDILGTLLDKPEINIYLKRNISLDIIKQVIKAREQSKIAHLEKRVSELEKKLSDQIADQSKVKEE
jgi:hypothetical protein